MSDTLIDTQITTELYYNKQAVYTRLEEDISQEPELLDCLATATSNIINWASGDQSYIQKKIRLTTFLENNEVYDLLVRAMVLVMMLDNRHDLLTSIAGQLASSVKGFDDYKDKVVTAGEILTLMADDDCFDMDQLLLEEEDEETGIVFKTKSWFIYNPWKLSTATVNHIKRAMYLPPMVTKPKKLTSNKDSAYLTITHDSVILGKQNYHNGEVCLESLNRFNNVPLAVNQDFITKIDALIKDDIVVMQRKTKMQYQKFMSDSMYVFAFLVKAGNKFYLPHKVDKRGRTYAQGYHASTQGNSLRKAAIELASKQIVEGSFYD